MQIHIIITHIYIYFQIYTYLRYAYTHHTQRLRESRAAGVYVEGLEKRRVESLSGAIAALKEGSERRTVGATLCNAQSSRSHAIFTLHIETEPCSCSDDEEGASGGSKNGGKISRVSTLHLVDLAGSERQKRTGAGSSRLTEVGFVLLARGEIWSPTYSLLTESRFLARRQTSTNPSPSLATSFPLSLSGRTRMPRLTSDTETASSPSSSKTPSVETRCAGSSPRWPLMPPRQERRKARSSSPRGPSASRTRSRRTFERRRKRGLRSLRPGRGRVGPGQK